MTEQTGRILLALARAAMPAGHGIPAPEDRMVEKVQVMLGAGPRIGVLAFVAALWILEWTAVLFHLRPLTRLPPAAAQRYVARWAHARAFLLRSLMRAALTPLKMAHFARADVSKQVGYDPPPVQDSPPVSGHELVENAAAHAGGSLRCQVVIVGSGPGGAVMATRLAERGMDVLILEEGRLFTRGDFNRRPAQMLRRMYRQGGVTVALGIPGIPIPLGKTVGGTSTVNSGTCFRAPDAVLNGWVSELGLDGYGPAALSEHYREAEEFLRVQPVPENVLGKVAEIIARGSDALGMSHKPLHRNADGCVGSGVCCFGCPSGAKRSMNESYIPRALNAGARLIAGARVTEIVRSGGRAVGVVAETGGAPLDVRADAVVIACGSIYTPPLLMNNGIGNGSGALGRNLSIHPATKVAGLFDETVRGWEGVPQGYCVDSLHHEGILFEGASMPPDAGSIGLPQVGARFTELMADYERIAFFGFLIEDTGRGRVVRGPGGKPQIFYNLEREDLAKLRRGTEVLSRIFFAAGAKTVFTPVAGHDELHSEADLARFQRARLRLGDFELSAFHPLGTCRMGSSPRSSVLKPTLEAWDTEALFVVDGSVFPTPLGVNPQMTIMAVSSLASQWVARRVG